jgi:hypothetical protein
MTKPTTKAARHREAMVWIKKFGAAALAQNSVFWERFDDCPVYGGFKLDDDDTQCRHPEASMAAWCDIDCCPGVRAAAREARVCVPQPGTGRFDDD